MMQNRRSGDDTAAARRYTAIDMTAAKREAAARCSRHEGDHFIDGGVHTREPKIMKCNSSYFYHY